MLWKTAMIRIHRSHVYCSLLLVATSLGVVLPVWAQPQFVEAGVGPPNWFNERFDEMSLADIDGDGDIDLVFVGTQPPTVLINNGHGVLASASGRVPSLAGLTAATMGDVDNDGDMDLVAHYSTVAGPDHLAVMVNDGRGAFTVASDIPTALLSVTLLSLFDADGDGDLDLIASGGLINGIFMNLGSALFRDETVGRLLSPITHFVTCRPADIDGDGWVDLVSAGPGVVNVLRNDGSGRFTLTQTISLPVLSAYWALPVPGDIERDGDRDVLVVTFGQDTLLVNDGAGRLTYDPTLLPVQLSLSHKAAFGDVDEDGDLDIVIANGANNIPVYVPWVYLNDGRGRFKDSTNTRLGSLPTGCVDVGLADLDGDRDLDVVFGRHRSGTGIQPMLFFTNRLRHVDAPASVGIGTTWPVTIWGRTGFAGGPQVAFPFGDTRLAPTPFRLPWGTVFLGSGLIPLPAVVLPPPSGSFTAQLPIPSAPFLVGQNAYVQAVVLHDLTSFGITRLGSGRITP